MLDQTNVGPTSYKCYSHALCLGDLILFRNASTENVQVSYHTFHSSLTGIRPVETISTHTNV